MENRRSGRIRVRTTRRTAPLPGWLRGLLDETFLWVALGQLLIALGVRPESVRRLSEVQAVLDEARAALGAAGLELPRLEGVRTEEDLERLGGQLDAMFRGIEEGGPVGFERVLPASQAVRWARAVADVLLDLAPEALEALSAHRVRTELVGLDQRALREALRRLRQILANADLEQAAAHGYEALGARLEQIADDEELDLEALDLESLDLETRPREPAPGEVGRIADVLLAVPRPTLDRLLPLRLLASRPVLVAALGAGLAQLRGQWVPPEERSRSATTHRVVVDGVELDAEQLRRREEAAEPRRRDRRAIDERDARGPARRRHLVQAGLLWAGSALLAVWMMLLVLGVLDPGMSPRSALGSDPVLLSALQLLPALAVAVLTGILAHASAVIERVDRAELAVPSAPSPPSVSAWEHRVHPARSARRGAARAAGGAAVGVMAGPLWMGLLIGVLQLSGVDLLGAGHLGWEFVVALLLPTPIWLLGHRRGVARGARLAAARGSRRRRACDRLRRAQRSRRTGRHRRAEVPPFSTRLA